jgi:hypothetical protein
MHICTIYVKFQHSCKALEEVKGKDERGTNTFLSRRLKHTHTHTHTLYLERLVRDIERG